MVKNVWFKKCFRKLLIFDHRLEILYEMIIGSFIFVEAMYPLKINQYARRL